MDCLGGDETSRVEKEPITKSSNGHKKGLPLWLASIFIVGEMAGSGVLALPKALADGGWGAVALLIFCCCNLLFAGIVLGRCWTIVEERYDEYKEKIRYPYPAIAYKAFGKKMRYLVSFCIDFTLIGVSTVFLLLSSQLIGNLASSLGVSFCYWVLILGAILCPLMWLGTPEDFWPAAVVALGTTVTAIILLIVSISKHSKTVPDPEFKSPTVLTFFLSYGTMIFSFGGAASFPTFQNDMKDRSQFPKAAMIGFTTLLVLYLPVAVLGYSIYGSSLDPDIINMLPNSPMKSAIEVLLSLHMFFAFLLVVNAPAQEFEEFFKIPRKFGYKRVLLRTCMMVGIIFIAMSIPRFGKILSLVGASSTTMTSSIFPCLFYLKLCSQHDPSWPERKIPTYQKCYLILIICCGIVGGIISTYSALNDIVKADTFIPPCYVNITAASQG